MELTKNFTLEELIASPAAKRLGINNTPSAVGKRKLGVLARDILQPIRDAWGAPIVVTSGYRCTRLNEAVGGSLTSDHVYSCAADIRTLSDTPEDNKKLWIVIVKLWKAGKLPSLKQCINEYGYDWIHVSYQDGRTSKKGQFLDAVRVSGTTGYIASNIRQVTSK